MLVDPALFQLLKPSICLMTITLNLLAQRLAHRATRTPDHGSSYRILYWRLDRQDINRSCRQFSLVRDEALSATVMRQTRPARRPAQRCAAWCSQCRKLLLKWPGALQHSRAQYAMAVSVSRPGGGSPEKPVGTVWLAWARQTPA